MRISIQKLVTLSLSSHQALPTWLPKTILVTYESSNDFFVTIFVTVKFWVKDPSILLVCQTERSVSL